MKLKVVILSTASIAVLAAAFTFVPVTLALPPAQVGSLPPATPPAGMSIYALPTGEYEARASLAFRGGPWSEVRRFASTAVLITHPKGNVLIDAGFGRRVDEHMRLIPALQRSPHKALVAVADQLRAASIPINKIAAIIPTHVHWDHISGIDDLPDVPVLVTAAGKRSIDLGVVGTEVIKSFRNIKYQLYAFEDGEYLGFPSSHDVWGDGSIVIVPAPGHTSDSVVVFVALPSGVRYALIGDLVWQSEGFNLPAEKPWMLRRLIGENDQAVHMDIARLRAAVQKYPQIKVIPAHDMSATSSLPGLLNTLQ
ncbi:MAG: MBL fold metallo-hydrolase [Luteimonas sp.]|nr:MBL fold metallo-hydrolase [Luteimonas sp.]